MTEDELKIRHDNIAAVNAMARELREAIRCGKNVTNEVVVVPPSGQYMYYSGDAPDGLTAAAPVLHLIQAYGIALLVSLVVPINNDPKNERKTSETIAISILLPAFSLAFGFVAHLLM